MPFAWAWCPPFCAFLESGGIAVDLFVNNCGREACAPGHRFGPAMRGYHLIHIAASGCGVFDNGAARFDVRAGVHDLPGRRLRLYRGRADAVGLRLGGLSRRRRGGAGGLGGVFKGEPRVRSRRICGDGAGHRLWRLRRHGHAAAGRSGGAGRAHAADGVHRTISGRTFASRRSRRSWA